MMTKLSWSALFILASVMDLYAGAPKLALLVKAPDNAFYDSIIFGAKEVAAELGFELKAFHGKNEDDWKFQVEFLKKNSGEYGGFILVPTRSDVFEVPLKKLSEKGKPVVIVDTPLSSGDEYVLSTINSDNRVGGALAGTFMANQLTVEPSNENCVVLFSGNPKARTHQERNEGFVSVLKATHKNMKVHKYVAMSNFEEAKKLAGENLDQIMKCFGVFAGSDTMILGVLDAFESRNLREPPILIGYDSLVEVQRKILEAKITASVQQSPDEMGRTAVRVLKDHFDNKEVEKKVVIDPRLTVRRFQLDSLSAQDLVYVSPKTKR